MTVESTINVSPSFIAPEDQVRADIYSLLGNLLLKVPSRTTLEQLAALRGEDGVVGSSINTLAQVAMSMDAGSVEREYNVLFIGMGRGEVLPYASYYLTGFLHEKPLADLRGSMRELGIQRKRGSLNLRTIWARSVK